MSHFSVAVFSKEGQAVEQLLAPYHEFECTGNVDEYVQSIDILAEAREQYEKDKTTKYKAPDGKLYSPYDDRFYRDPTEEEQEKIGCPPGSGCARGISWRSSDWNNGKGYRAKVCYIPDGYEEVELQTSGIMSFRDYVHNQYERPIILENEDPDIHEKHKWGWTRVNSKGEVIELIDRTNPNKEWDWWITGGRWEGLLLSKNGERVDSARLKEIDWDGMKTSSAKEAKENWQKAHRGSRDFCKRVIYGIHKDDTEESYIQRQTEFATFAVITPDGMWHEKGDMGWWGCSSATEEEAKKWHKSYMEAFINNADPELTITIVDCHI